MTKGRIRLVFFYEALILVFASCLLGIFVGTLVGYTMTLQENLFMHTKSDFVFPWKATLEILVLSILCSFGATFGPSSQLLRKQIAAIFRIM